MAKKIREIMTTSPRTVEPTTTIVDAARLMRDEDVGPIPIVENNQCAGILTDRDIVLRVVAEGRDPATTTVGDVASRDLITIDPEQTLDEAARLMAQHQVRRLPVCEEDGHLVGIIAQADLALTASEKTTGEVVEEISRH
jgi:CBS domain-containing protein